MLNTTTNKDKSTTISESGDIDNLSDSQRILAQQKPLTFWKKIPNGIKIFALAFLMYILAALPIIIEHGGLFFYYGDYNVQQVPFYILAHRAVRSGSFSWNWNLDLGGTLIGDLSFYLCGSPFFWITIPFSVKILPYLMPYLMGLKYATAATTSYYYIKRYTKHNNTAIIGCLLYAFSGFDACNIVFNHFTDVVAFFPLLLIAFDDLMKLDDKKEKGKFVPGGYVYIRFCFAATLMVTINYYFFFGEAIFLVIYAVIRYARSNSFVNVRRMILRALSGGILGVGLGAFYLVMVLEGVAGNTRLDNILLGYDTIIYESSKRYLDIIKSMVMIPDIIGKGTLFYTSEVKNSSLAVYLPLFGLAGVIAYVIAKKKDWKKTLIITSLVIAFVPILNAMFSLFNTQYYCRWYFMPILFMAIMTCQMIESENQLAMRIGTLATTLLFLFIVLISVLPSRDDNGNVVYMQMAENQTIFWKQVIGTAILSIMLILIIFLVRKKRRRINALLFATVFGGVLSTFIVLQNGKSLISDYGMVKWQEQMLDTKPDLDESSFSRIETDSTSTNYEMVWGIPTVHCFLSTVPSEIFDFYEGTAGITRTVESEIPNERIGLRAILSCRYYLENSDINKNGDFSQGNGIVGYNETALNSEQNGFTIYENINYIPMGFTFDNYVTQSTWDSIVKASGDQTLVKAIILSDEDAAKYGSLLNELSASDIEDSMSNETFIDECNDRAATSCTSFETTKSGFVATTSNLSSENLVFFSVPALSGFTATVDGEKTDIIKADYGMIAIDCSAGVHEIVLTYHYQNLPLGVAISLLCLLAVIAYIVVYKKKYQSSDINNNQLNG